MSRHHMTVEGAIPFTAEEESEYDAIEIAFAKKQSKILIKNKIFELEFLITPRRTREAILGIDNGWLADIELQIQELRGQL